MLKIILFTALLTLIYSWEESVDFFLRLFDKRRIKGSRFLADRTVATALLLVAIPLAVICAFENFKNFGLELALVAVTLFVLAVIAFGTEELALRMKRFDQYHGLEKVGLVGFAIAGLISPTIGLITSHPRSDQKLIAKYSLFLSIVIFAIFLSNRFVPQSFQDLTKAVTVLNIILVGELSIFIATEFLKRHFRMEVFSVLTSMRIILGLLVIFVLYTGLA